MGIVTESCIPLIVKKTVAGVIRRIVCCDLTCIIFNKYRGLVKYPSHDSCELCLVGCFVTISCDCVL